MTKRLKHERRVMKRGEVFDIEERIADGDWTTVCECATINDAKSLLKNLRILDEEEKNERKNNVSKRA